MGMVTLHSIIAIQYKEQLKKIEILQSVASEGKKNSPGNDYIQAFPAWHLYIPSNARESLWQLFIFCYSNSKAHA